MNRPFSTSMAIFCLLALAVAISINGCGSPPGTGSNNTAAKGSPTPTSTPAVTSINCGDAGANHTAILSAIYSHPCCNRLRSGKMAFQHQ